jgi:hypothetical protein
MDGVCSHVSFRRSAPIRGVDPTRSPNKVNQFLVLGTLIGRICLFPRPSAFEQLILEIP